VPIREEALCGDTRLGRLERVVWRELDVEEEDPAGVGRAWTVQRSGRGREEPPK